MSGRQTEGADPEAHVALDEAASEDVPAYFVAGIDLDQFDYPGGTGVVAVLDGDDGTALDAVLDDLLEVLDEAEDFTIELVPEAGPAGDIGPELVVYGSGFSEAATIHLARLPLPTYRLDEHALVTEQPLDLVDAEPGLYEVTVVEPGGRRSAPAWFEVG